MSQDGYDVEVISEVSNELYCVICLKLMQNAVHMHCGHGMCNACYQKLIKSSKERYVLNNKDIFNNNLLCLCRKVNYN